MWATNAWEVTSDDEVKRRPEINGAEILYAGVVVTELTCMETLIWVCINELTRKLFSKTTGEWALIEKMETYVVRVCGRKIKIPRSDELGRPNADNHIIFTMENHEFFIVIAPRDS